MMSTTAPEIPERTDITPKYTITTEVLELLSPLHRIVAETLIKKGEWIVVDELKGMG